jgi:hypothetical protein
MTWVKFASTPKCPTKISHLSLRGLNVIENKGEIRWRRMGVRGAESEGRKEPDGPRGFGGAPLAR